MVCQNTSNFLKQSLLITNSTYLHINQNHIFFIETKKFVSLLFIVLEKQDYTLPVPPAISQLATGEAPSSTTEVEVKSEAPAVSVPEQPKVSIAPPQVPVFCQQSLSLISVCLIPLVMI